MAAITYLDFDLLIEGSEAGYRARVLNSPAGQAAAEFTLPFSELELENFLLRVGRPRQGVRHWGSSQMKAARDFGGRLFEAVFDGEVQTCLRRSLDEVHRQGTGLRIRLRLDHVPELADVPWEYLYNATLNRFLSLSAKTPVVRYPALPERILPLAVKLPLKVLVMISSTSDCFPLDVDQEWTKLKDALCTLEQQGLVALERLEEATLAALQRRLRRGANHIFHFIGHGGFDEQVQDGVLIMENEQGGGHPVSGERLGTLLHDHSPPLRLAILNACEGARASRSDPFAGTAQRLVQQGIPAVIAMQFEITDKTAITFAHEFYSALSDDYPVDAALAEARKAIFAQGNDVEWGTPVLYMRSRDGQLFDIERVPGLEPLSERKKEVQDRLAKDRERLKAWEGKLHRARDSEEEANFKEMIRVLHEDIEASRQKATAIEEELWRLNVARLDRLYAEAEQAERIPDWTEAISIFQRILDIDKDYKDTPQRLTQAKKQERLDRLYAQVEQAEAIADWVQVAHLCQQILNVDEGYKDTPQKLVRAKERERLDRLYAKVERAEAIQDWAQVIRLCQQILDIDEDYKDTSQKLVRAKERERLDQLYAEVEQAEVIEDWAQVVHLCQKILNVDRGYKDASRKLAQAKEKQCCLLWKKRLYSLGQRIRSFCARHKTCIVAVLVLAATAFGIWRLWPTIMPTEAPTPIIPSEHVVIEIDGVVVDASDDRRQEIVCNSSTRIQVTVQDSTGVPIQPDIFSYNWRFNPPDPHNPDRLDSKSYAIIYSIPCDRNNQMVTIEVFKDGEMLEIRSTCLNINKQP